MFPLTFDEYIDMKAFLGKSISQDITEEFDTYLREGGFPKAIQYDSTEDRRTYIKGIVTEIFEKSLTIFYHFAHFVLMGYDLILHVFSLCSHLHGHEPNQSHQC